MTNYNIQFIEKNNGAFEVVIKGANIENVNNEFEVREKITSSFDKVTNIKQLIFSVANSEDKCVWYGDGEIKNG